MAMPVRRPRPSAEPAVDLRTKVAFLLRPENYPERTRRVEAKETHMSWVFLTDSHAYKLKKPVRYPFLDYSTIEARRTNCEAEIRLNRRLAPDVYLETVPLGIDRSGRLCLGGGRPIDWLVKMRRLGADRTLDQKIRRNAVTQADIRRLGARLGAFYRRAPRMDVSPESYRRRFGDDVGLTRRILLRGKYALPAPPVRDIALALRRYLKEHGARLDQRIVEGRVVEGHGDLRPEHVYLGPDPLVADCLEFNLELRTVDPADELAYLVMECEREGAMLVGPWLFQAYGEATGDRPPPDLVAFYKCHRAFLRARIAIAHLDEPDLGQPGKWRERARSYLKLAKRYIPLFARPKPLALGSQQIDD
jgi:aminoglycoside phosphotransferase family enzyme